MPRPLLREWTPLHFTNFQSKGIFWFLNKAILEILYLPCCLSVLPTYGSLPLGVGDVLVFKASPRSRGLEWTMYLLEELCRGSSWRIWGEFLAAYHCCQLTALFPSGLRTYWSSKHSGACADLTRWCLNWIRGCFSNSFFLLFHSVGFKTVWLYKFEFFLLYNRY